MIASRKNYKLYAPQHCWDTNYHLLDGNKKIEYLIDIHDVTDNDGDVDDGLFIGTLLKLEDIDGILDYVWKQKAYTSVTYR